MCHFFVVVGKEFQRVGLMLRQLAGQACHYIVIAVEEEEAERYHFVPRKWVKYSGLFFVLTVEKDVERKLNQID